MTDKKPHATVCGEEQFAYRFSAPGEPQKKLLRLKEPFHKSGENQMNWTLLSIILIFFKARKELDALK